MIGDQSAPRERNASTDCQLIGGQQAGREPGTGGRLSSPSRPFKYQPVEVSLSTR